MPLVESSQVVLARSEVVVHLVNDVPAAIEVHPVVDAAAPVDVVKVRAIELTLLGQVVLEQSSGVETGNDASLKTPAPLPCRFGNRVGT